MKTLFAVLVVFLTLSAFNPAVAQDAPTLEAAASAVARDPVAVAQQAVASMGGASALVGLQDSVGTGTLTLAGPSPKAMPIVLKTQGTRKVRSELQTPEGTRVRILNDGRAAALRPDGSVKWLSVENTLAERVSHIPALSLLAENADANVGVEYMGPGVVNGQPAEVVGLSFTPSSDVKQAAEFLELTRCLFFVDPGSGTIAKIEYTHYAEGHRSTNWKEEVFLSDYRSVEGVLVPFKQITLRNGELESALELSSIQFNVGLADSEFALPVEVADAK
jgi:hypothetical protein